MKFLAFCILVFAAAAPAASAQTSGGTSADVLASIIIGPLPPVHVGPPPAPWHWPPVFPGNPPAWPPVPGPIIPGQGCVPTPHTVCPL